MSLNPNNCYFYFKKDFIEYDLQNLKFRKDEGSIIKIFSLEIDKKIVKGKIFINLCGEVNIPIYCGQMQKSSILFVSEEKDLCVNLIYYEKRKNNFSYADLNNKDKGFFIQKKEEDKKIYLKTDKKPKKVNSQKKKLLKYQNLKTSQKTNQKVFQKNSSKKINKTSFLVHLSCTSAELTLYHITTQSLEIITPSACGNPLKFPLLYNSQKYLISITLIILGISLLFLGGIYPFIILPTFGFIFGIFCTFFLFWIFNKIDSPFSSYLILSIIAFIIGILFAVLNFSFIVFRNCLLSLNSAFVFCFYILLLCDLVFLDMIFFYIIYAIVEIVFLGFSIFFYNYMVFINSAVLGSFFFVLHFGWLFGFLGNFLDIDEKKKFGDLLKLEDYLFFSFFIVFIIFGILFQIRLFHKKRQIKERNKHLNQTLTGF